MIDAIIEFFNNNVGISLVTGLGAASIVFAIIWKVIDGVLINIVKFIFSKDKWILNIIKFVDDKVIDVLKIKTPATGKLIEKRIIELLTKIRKIIQDENNK